MGPFHVYILASRSRILYVGVTNHLARRIYQHREEAPDGFTHRYKVDRLVYCEAFLEVRPAIEREKQIKGWKRAKKIALIESLNPTWEDLSSKL